MRNIFIKELMQYASEDKNLIVLTADLGYRAFEPFRDAFPAQFLNVGAAEANMVGLASGLALCGKKVVIYSIVPFITYRVYEYVRNDICLNNLDVKIVGVGGGFSYGAQGHSHSSLGDLSVMRTLPNMSVICPAERKEASKLVSSALRMRGPAYIRLGKAPEEAIYGKDIECEIGRSILVSKGNDLAIFSIGNTLNIAVETAKILDKSGINARVISMPCLKPLDARAIIKAAKETGKIFTIEEHSLIGGLGSAVSEVLSDSGLAVAFKKFALPDEFTSHLGTQEYLRKAHGLSPELIAKQILRIASKR